MASTRTEIDNTAVALTRHGRLIQPHRGTTHCRIPERGKDAWQFLPNARGGDGDSTESSDLRVNPHLHVLFLDGAYHEHVAELEWHSARRFEDPRSRRRNPEDAPPDRRAAQDSKQMRKSTRLRRSARQDDLRRGFFQAPKASIACRPPITFRPKILDKMYGENGLRREHQLTPENLSLGAYPPWCSVLVHDGKHEVGHDQHSPTDCQQAGR